MGLVKILVFTMAATFIAFGAAYWLWPDAMVSDIGINFSDPMGRIDLRAVYGGMQLGIGLFLFYCLRSEQTLRIALIAALLILGCLAGSRAVGMLLAAGNSQLMWLLLGVEALGVPLAIVGLILLNTAQHGRAG